MHYSIAVNPPKQELKIILTPSKPADDQVFSLPVWRPGRYELANYVQYMYPPKAFTASGKILKVRPIGKCSWKVENPKHEAYTLTYAFQAAQLDGGGSWVDEELIYINFLNCLLYQEGNTSQEHRVQLEIPDHFTIATNLTFDKDQGIIAENYDQLVDRPVLAAARLEHLEYEAGGKTFHIWLYGERHFPSEKMLKEFKAFSERQGGIFGDFPFRDYHFLILLLPYRFYHGVEHLESTVIVIGPDHQLSKEGPYDQLLGVSSHELFHAWNIKCLRPKELQPYPWDRESHFETGYVAEGFTTYYGDLMIKRSGIRDLNWYLKEVNTLMKRHFSNAGRHHASLATSSMQLWADGYKVGIPDRKVSIYVKGALVALLMDWNLLSISQGSKRLDNLMAALYQDSGIKKEGYETTDILNGLQSLAPGPWEDWFEEWIYGVEPLESHFEALAPAFGLHFYQKSSDYAWEKWYGFEVKSNDCLEVGKIDRRHPQAVELRKGDQLIGIQHQSPSLEGLEALCEQKKSLEVLLKRNNEVKSLTIHPEASGDYHSYYQVKFLQESKLQSIWLS